jgi:hypothetical protein
MDLMCNLTGMEIRNLYEPFALELRETDNYIARASSNGPSKTNGFRS